MKNVKIVRQGATARVGIREKLTAAEVPALQPALRKELTAGVREIVFDLAATETLDSTGIGLLIATSNSLAAVQGTIRLVGVAPAIRKLLQSMRLAERLHVEAAGSGETHG